jgi:hypothetical protein
LLVGSSGSLDDAPNGALSDAIRLRATKDGRMKLPSQFAGRSSKFKGAVRVETLDRDVASKRKKGFLRVLGRVGELGKALQQRVPRSYITTAKRSPCQLRSSADTER